MPRMTRLAILGIAILAATGAARSAMPTDPIVIFAFGDSLTAGYGLPPKDAFPVKLQAALRAKGYTVEVVNGGVSGDTSQNGLDRLDWSLPEHTDAAIVEFGANDALQGLPPASLKTNLQSIVTRLKSKGIEVMLSGMLAPRNLGESYSEKFDPIFADIAKANDCILYPFYLDSVAFDRKLNQADQMHPNADGVDVIVARITPTVEKLIARVMADRATHGPHSGP